MSIVINPNTPPSSITFKQKVSFSTLDQNNNNAPLAEAYKVSGPVCAGVTPISIAGGAKAVIPLSTASGNGAPFLKITYPTSTDNNLYVTYCVAANNMQDGYYDYKTGVPSTYMTALRNWIAASNPLSSSSVTTVKTRSLKFSFYGTSTNKTSNSTTFYINFTGTFGGTSSSVVSTS